MMEITTHRIGTTPRHHSRAHGARRAPAAVIALAATAVALAAASSLRAQASPARLTLQDDPADDQLVLTLGPLTLPANATHHDVQQPRAQDVVIPRDGWIRGFSAELVDAAGREVPHVVLHHLNLIMPDRRELFSPIMLRIGAMGQETAPVELPRLLGMRVHKGEHILVTSMYHNPTDRSYDGVQLRVKLPFIPDDTWLPPMSVYPFYMDVMPPAGIHEYDLPPGKSHKSWEGSPAVAARILGVGGHLHKYATLLRLEDVTAHEVLWDARPELGADGDIVGMPTGKFWWHGGIKIEPDHVYRLTAFYDNPTGQTIPGGAMGALGGIVVPARGTNWPPVDPNDPELRRDVAVTYGGMEMQMEEMSGMHTDHPATGAKAAPPGDAGSATGHR